jgi:hypothetical protein
MSGDIMNGLLRLSARVYGGMLLLYPLDLRREFGPEMGELFGEDLMDGWRSSGFAGVLRVWWCAVCEVLRVAIPGQRTNPAFVVPAIAFVFSLLAQCGPLLSIRHALAQESSTSVLLVVLCALVLPSVVTAMTAVVVVHIGKVRVVSLGLSSLDDRTLCSKSAI